MRAKTRITHRSVAIWSFAIELRSSWLVAADVFVSGVFTDEPFTEPEGVEVPVVVDASVAPLPFADCFAAFSARRFCFDADGAIFAFTLHTDCLEKERDCDGWREDGMRKGEGGRRERTCSVRIDALQSVARTSNFRLDGRSLPQKGNPPSYIMATASPAIAPGARLPREHAYSGRRALDRA